MLVLRSLLAVSIAIALSAGAAQAAPDLEGSTTIVEPNGLYTVVKVFQVYSDTNTENPNPVAGNFTYVYHLTNDASSNPAVPVIGFDVTVPAGSVTSASFLAGVGVEPSATIVGTTVVRWEFAVDQLDPGETSDALIIVSPFSSGTVADTLVSLNGAFSLDAPGTCVGPLNPPVPECNLEILKEGCVVQTPDVIGDQCDGKLVSFTFQYTGLGCSASSNLQDPKKAKCVGDAMGASPVDILVTTGKFKNKKKSGKAGGKSHKKQKSKKTNVLASATGVQVGDTVVVSAAAAGKEKLKNKTFIKISDASGVLEKIRLHTSCSQPFSVGNQFGSATIVALTSTQGGTVTLPTTEPDECVTTIDLTAPPHCQGKVQNLGLRYTGGDCTATLTSQAAGKVACTDGAPISADPVELIVVNGTSSTSTPYVDVTPVNLGDIIDVPASGAGLSQFGATTGYWIRDAATGQILQDGFFHTSCSQPLNLGDQIGGLQVFSLATTQGGAVALGSDVEYTYEVTNPNADAITNVSVDDDQLGNIASGLSIPAGMSTLLTQTALIEADTTNVATVTGDVAGQQCIPASDTVSIVVQQPPEPGLVCTAPIRAMLLRYTGPDILGATVDVVPRNFENTNTVVSFGPLDLIGGVTELSLPVENGFTVDAAAHGELQLGSKTTISINGVPEVIHTSCSVPFESNQPAPLDMPKGAPSSNWFVVSFEQKDM